MKTIEKITISVILLVLITSFSIYGVWEEKMTFLSFLIPVLYAALALWCAWRLTPGVRAEKEDRGLRTEDRGLRTEDRGLRTEDRGLKTEDRGLKTEAVRPSSTFNIPPAGGMLFLFWLYSAVMIPFSVIPYEAKVSTLRLGCYVGTYWVIANLLSRFPRRRAVWCTLLVTLLAVALYSLVQHKVDFEMLYGQLRYVNYGERLGGTYICPNHIAHLLQMWIPLCLVFLFVPQMGWFWRICFGYAIPVFSLLIYQTQSRAGMLGTIAAVGTLFLLLMLRRSRKAFVIALVAAPLLMAAGVGGLWVGSSMFRERMQPALDVVIDSFNGDWEHAISVDFRPQTWMDSLIMFTERPWFGFGPGNYGLTFPEYRQRVSSNKMLTVHPHNEPLELLTEYGLVGTALFVGALIAFCVPLVRLVKTSDRLYHVLPAAACLAALAGTLVHGLFDFELRIFPNALMLAVLAGCAISPLCGGGRKTEDGLSAIALATAGGRMTEDGLSAIALATAGGRKTGS